MMDPSPYYEAERLDNENSELLARIAVLEEELVERDRMLEIAAVDRVAGGPERRAEFIADLRTRAIGWAARAEEGA